MVVAQLYRREGNTQRRLGSISNAVATGVLPFAPPDVTYTDLHVTKALVNGAQDWALVLSPGVNYNLIFDEVMTQRLKITGGNHIKIIGAEVNVNVQTSRAGFTNLDGAYYDNSNAFEFTGQTGTVFLEGIWCHGTYLLDSIRVANGSVNSTWVIQNCSFDCDAILSGMNGGDGFVHTDGFQCWGGLKSLTMYNVTIANPYQGGMFGDGALVGRWGPMYLGRVNYRCGRTAGQATKMINFVGNADYMRGPAIIDDDVYYLPGASTTWDNTYVPAMIPPYTGGAFYSGVAIGTDAAGRDYGQINAGTITGMTGAFNPRGGPARIFRGLPPGGDYVTGGGTGPGMGYVSPGYVAPLTPPAIPGVPAYTATYPATY